MVIDLDDPLRFSNTKTEHQQHLQLVLQRLKKNKPYVFLQKCSLLKPEVEFLDLLANRNRIRIDRAKIEVIKEWPQAENLTDLSGFIALVQFSNIF